MNLEDVKKVMLKACPEMLSNDNFMTNAVVRYVEGKYIDRKTLSKSEYKAWDNLCDVLGTATVGQLIKQLKENFKPTDKLCYMDCVEGCKNDCTYVTKDQLGKRFFYYVKDLKTQFYKDVDKETADSQYPYVNDNDVVVC